MNATRCALAAAASAVVLTGPLSLVAQAAPPDTTPPAVSVELAPRYIVGEQVTDHKYGPGDVYHKWSFRMNWTAYDASGICGQTITENDYSAMGDTYKIGKDVRSLTFTTDDLDFMRGGFSAVIHATDCAGNTSNSNTTRESGVFTEDTASTITYTGPWATAHFSGFGSGTTHDTTVAGASLLTSVRGGALGLVMEKAANRGSVDVYIDGTKAATVDTHAATTVHRTVVWQTLLSPGVHTLGLVNDATPGHPRIDLDAIAN